MAPIKVLCILLMLLFIVMLIPHVDGHKSDTGCWTYWAQFIHEHGLGNVYQSYTDYPPILHYELWLFGKMSASQEAIAENIKYLKCITVFFDLAGLWYLYKWLDNKVDFLVIFILCLFNTSYSYDSMIWGQFDGMLAALVFISLYYGYNNKPVLSALVFLVAINFKVQAIVFLPIWGLLYLNTLISSPKPGNFIYPFLSMVTLQTLILYPFIKAGAVKEVYRVVVESVGKYPNVGMGSKNFWSFFVGSDPELVPDSLFWFGEVTYKQAGLFMFFTISFLILLPILVRTVKRIKQPVNEQLKISKHQLWLTSALIVMVFYFFNTQMHERYVHPAFIFIAAYSFSSRNAFPFALFSVALFFNMEDELHFCKLGNYETLIFHDAFIAGLFGILMIYLAVKLARSYSSIKIGNKGIAEMSLQL